MKKPKYHIEVHEEKGVSRMFRWRVELHDTNRKKILPHDYKYTRVRYDWVDYKFMTKWMAKKLLKTQRAKDEIALH